MFWQKKTHFCDDRWTTVVALTGFGRRAMQAGIAATARTLLPTFLRMAVWPIEYDTLTDAPKSSAAAFRAHLKKQSLGTRLKSTG